VRRVVEPPRREANTITGMSVSLVADDNSSVVAVRYRRDDGDLVESTLDRVSIESMVAGVPVREFRWYKGRRFYSGWYWSSTTGGLVAYESRLELARILLADFAPDVTGLAAQPFQLVGRDAGRLRRHIPDLLLVHPGGGVTVVDVKPAGKLDDPEVRAVFDWTARLCSLRGWAFEAWSGADAQLLANVGFLAGYRRSAVIATGLADAVLAAAGDTSTIGAVERALAGSAPAALVRPVVCHLLWRGELMADMSRPIGCDTPISTVLGDAT